MKQTKMAQRSVSSLLFIRCCNDLWIVSLINYTATTWWSVTECSTPIFGCSVTSALSIITNQSFQWCLDTGLKLRACAALCGGLREGIYADKLYSGFRLFRKLEVIQLPRLPMYSLSPHYSYHSMRQRGTDTASRTMLRGSWEFYLVISYLLTLKYGLCSPRQAQYGSA